MIADMDEKFKRELNLRENAEASAKNAIDRMSANERMADLGRLVASVTHELGNPPGATVALSTSMAASGKKTFDLYEKDELSEDHFHEFVMDVHQSSELIYRNMEQARSLINGFKTAASDQVILDIRTFDAGQNLKTFLKVYEPVMKKKGYTLEISSEPGLIIYSIPGILTQILSNLVNNALIHGVEGLRQGTIKVECHRENDNIALRVEDNGKGIPADIQDKIFDIYFTTKKGKGETGVGLPIVHSLVEEELKGFLHF